MLKEVTLPIDAQLSQITCYNCGFEGEAILDSPGPEEVCRVLEWGFLDKRCYCPHTDCQKAFREFEKRPW